MPENRNEETYRRIVDDLGPEPLAGSLIHMCVRTPDDLRYIDVWATEELCARAFEERIHPAVDRALGGSRPGEPTVQHLDVVHVSGALLPEPARDGAGPATGR